MNKQVNNKIILSNDFNIKKKKFVLYCPYTASKAILPF